VLCYLEAISFRNRIGDNPLLIREFVLVDHRGRVPSDRPRGSPLKGASERARARQMRSRTRNRRSDFRRDKKREPDACVVATEALTLGTTGYIRSGGPKYPLSGTVSPGLVVRRERPRRRARGAHSKKTRYRSARAHGGP